MGKLGRGPRSHLWEGPRRELHLLIGKQQGDGSWSGPRGLPGLGPRGSPHRALHKLGSGKAVEGVTSGSRRGPRRSRAIGGGAEAQVRGFHWAVVWAGLGAAVRQVPPPARGDLRGGGGGERAGLRRRLAGGLPPLGPPRPGRSGSDAASGGLGVGEPAAALGGPGGAQAGSLGKGGGYAGPAGPRLVLRRAHVQPRPLGAETLQFPAANPVFLT